MRPARHLLGLLALVSAATLAGAPAAQAAGAPQVPATWPTELTTTGANLRAEVNPDGFPTTYRFEYLSEAAYEANPPANRFAGALKAPSGPEAPIGSGEAPVAVVQHIGALKANTAYRFHLVATNSAGTTEGPLRYLRTDESAPLFSLPDNRAWELVSPLDKGGGQIAQPQALFGGGVLQGAAQGSAVTYGSQAAFAGPTTNPGANQYLSQRTASGWATENLTIPAQSGSYGDDPDGVPYRLFSGDLAKALVQDPHRCETEPCPRSVSIRTTANGALTHSSAEPDLAFQGASPDLKALVLASCAALTPNATEVPGPEGCDPSKPNLYRWDGTALTLINLLPGESTGTPGAQLAAQSKAISQDGTRVYFTHAGNLYLRDGSQTVQVDEDVAGEGAFETASSNGAVAFFSKAAHLYRYELASETATDLTPGGELLGVLGSAEDASRLYYATTSGLFLRQGAITTPVATGADAVQASNYPPTTGTARVSADGTKLAFSSQAELSPYDNAGQAEAYLYNASTTTLTCASCNPSGERPLGPASLPGAIANGSTLKAYKPRALSQNGNRLFFESFDSLLPQDTNSDRDVYQWQANGSGSCANPKGCVNLISSGRSEDGASFLDASADGADAFFLTDGSLVVQDPGLVDLYDARVGGGFPQVQPPLPCLGDACQPLPPEPEDPNPGTLFTGTAPNPPLVFPKERKQNKGKGKKGKSKRKGSKGKRGKGKRGKGKGNKQGKRGRGRR